jgi:hypothetical protein
MSKRIKILFLSASPTNAGRLRVDVEAREISEKLEEGDARAEFELIQCHALRPTDIQRYLMKHKPHIVHFSGHSSRNKRIILEDATGESKAIEPKALAAIFRLLRDNIKIVVLNACFTLPQAQAISETIDFTIGINKTIRDKTAITFAGAFYRALSFGRTIQEAFESGQVELGALGIRGPNALEFLVRDGADPTRTILHSHQEPGKSKGDVWKTTLSRLSAGLSTEQEVQSVRRAMMNGRLILDQTEDVVSSPHGKIEAIKSLSVGKASHVEVDPSLYRRIQEQLYPPPPGLPPPPPGLLFIGREDSLAHFKKILKSPNRATMDVNLTVVRGWPGVGKTTLAGVLGRDPEILKAFPQGVLWTSLDRQPEIMSKLAEWGRALGVDDLLRIPGQEEAVGKLAAILRRRKMLLIVDDIWDTAHAWPFIHAAVGTRCAVLATTRLPLVAENLTLDEKRVHLLPVLTEDNSLLLLSHIIPHIVEQYPQECRELVRDLECLPLALHVAGRLLKEESKIGFSVSDLITEIRKGTRLMPAAAPPDRIEGTKIPTVQALLKKSTDALDDLSRDCFAFLGVFAPKPATFDFDAMKAVWEIADPKPIIKNLVRYGLLEPVGPNRFQLHDLLVQHAYTLLS